MTLPSDNPDPVLDEDGDKIDPSLAEMHRELLRSLHARLAAPRRFEPGQFVYWMPGLRNRPHPLYGQPAIVIEQLDRPLYDATQSPADVYFREPLDLVLGILDGDGELFIFHFDSRRFSSDDAAAADAS